MKGYIQTVDIHLMFFFFPNFYHTHNLAFKIYMISYFKNVKAQKCLFLRMVILSFISFEWESMTSAWHHICKKLCIENNFVVVTFVVDIFFSVLYISEVILPFSILTVFETGISEMFSSSWTFSVVCNVQWSFEIHNVNGLFVCHVLRGYVKVMESWPQSLRSRPRTDHPRQMPRPRPGLVRPRPLLPRPRP